MRPLTGTICSEMKCSPGMSSFTDSLWIPENHGVLVPEPILAAGGGADAGESIPDPDLRSPRHPGPGEGFLMRAGIRYCIASATTLATRTRKLSVATDKNPRSTRSMSCMAQPGRKFQQKIGPPG